jgi:3-methyladenine DNA glycosylase AlkD
LQWILKSTYPLTESKKIAVQAKTVSLRLKIIHAKMKKRTDIMNEVAGTTSRFLWDGDPSDPFMSIFEMFRAAANPEKAVFISAYMRNQFPFLGIPAPERRKMSRHFLKTLGKKAIDWDFVFSCWQQPEREFQYLAKDYLAKVKAGLTPSNIPNLRELVISKSWWDTVDGLDVIVGNVALRYPEVNATLLNWSVDENFWLRRLAIDHQLTRREKTNTQLLEHILVNNLGQTEFFINKAVGWALRDYSKTNPHWVRDFIGRHRSKMAPLSIREASKYI